MNNGVRFGKKLVTTYLIFKRDVQPEPALENHQEWKFAVEIERFGHAIAVLSLSVANHSFIPCCLPTFGRSLQ